MTTESTPAPFGGGKTAGQHRDELIEPFHTAMRQVAPDATEIPQEPPTREDCEPPLDGQWYYANISTTFVLPEVAPVTASCRPSRTSSGARATR